MNLTARRRHAVPGWCVVGSAVRADAPTVQVPIVGTVEEIDGLVVTVRTLQAMLVAVDVEDCRPAWSGLGFGR